ncbi:type IV pilus modification protein PilV [Moraxella osloensis]|nr:type IV pilus modification protein PilV [Moraxella osloensis]MBW4008927.1 type IV pilus modification protein PilV [Moraxella osloensis]
MRYHQYGVGLIEVLVSLLILAVAILGFSAMQMQSIKSTSESVDRSQTLLMMRSLAEKIRANPTAIATYQDALNKVYADMNKAAGAKETFPQPSNLCIGSTMCTATDIANAEVWKLKTQLTSTGLQMDLQPCPSTGGGGTTASTNVMYSYCLITAWGNTTPTIGTDDNPIKDPKIANDKGTMDCLTPRDASNTTNIKTGGKYHPKATCMFLEIN